MIFLSYLPKKDRNRLIEVNDLLQKTLDMELRRPLEDEKSEILSKSKTLQQCTYDDLVDFKVQLYQRYTDLCRINAANASDILKDIMAVERYEQVRLQQLQVAEIRKEEAPKVERKRPTTGNSSWFTSKPIDDDL